MWSRSRLGPSGTGRRLLVLVSTNLKTTTNLPCRGPGLTLTVRSLWFAAFLTPPSLARPGPHGVSPGVGTPAVGWSQVMSSSSPAVVLLVVEARLPASVDVLVTDPVRSSHRPVSRTVTRVQRIDQPRPSSSPQPPPGVHISVGRAPVTHWHDLVQRPTDLLGQALLGLDRGLGVWLRCMSVLQHITQSLSLLPPASQSCAPLLSPGRPVFTWLDQTQDTALQDGTSWGSPHTHHPPSDHQPVSTKCLTPHIRPLLHSLLHSRR